MTNYKMTQLVHTLRSLVLNERYKFSVKGKRCYYLRNCHSKWWDYLWRMCGKQAFGMRYC